MIFCTDDVQGVLSCVKVNLRPKKLEFLNTNFSNDSNDYLATTGTTDMRFRKTKSKDQQAISNRTRYHVSFRCLLVSSSFTFPMRQNCFSISVQMGMHEMHRRKPWRTLCEVANSLTRLELLSDPRLRHPSNRRRLKVCLPRRLPLLQPE